MKSSLVPTPLIDASEVRPIVIVEQVAPRTAFALWLRVVRFAFRYVVDSRIRRVPALQRARSVREFLESMGGMWVKAGQLLSLRTDLFSREVVDELSVLQYRSFGFDPKVARALIESELGSPIERLFDEFDEMPFAAASISQIHRARLRGGQGDVVVKVQRPGIATVLTRDLGLISFLLRRMKSVQSLSHFDWEGMVRELQRMFTEEVDYRYEVSNLRRMRKILDDHKVVVPRVHKRLCTTRIIVMEYVHGVVMSDYIRLRRSDPGRVEAWQAENGIVPAKVGARLMKSFYRQILEDNLFHGDLHPGNIMLLRDNRFALIDFGTIGTLDPRFVKLYRQQAQSFAVADFGKAIDTYLLLADSMPAFDLDAYRTEFTEAARAWESRTHLQGLSYLERSLTGGIAMALSDINQRYRVNLSWQFLRVGRSISTMDANLSTLLGDANPNKILRSYFRQYRKRSMRALRQTALGRIGSVVTEVMDAYDYVSTSLRRQAIPMQALPSRISQALEAAVRVAFSATVLVGFGVVTTYALFRERYIDTLLGDLHARIDMHPFEWSLAGLVGLVLLVRLRVDLSRIFGRPAWRKPDGSSSS